MSYIPPIDNTAICPACDGSGSGVADTQCGFCGGSGGVPIAAAQGFDRGRATLAQDHRRLTIGRATFRQA